MDILLFMSSTNQKLPNYIINHIFKIANLSYRVLNCEINTKESNTINILIMRSPHPNAIILQNLSCWNLYRMSIENY